MLIGNLVVPVGVWFYLISLYSSLRSTFVWTICVLGCLLDTFHFLDSCCLIEYSDIVQPGMPKCPNRQHFYPMPGETYFPKDLFEENMTPHSPEFSTSEAGRWPIEASWTAYQPFKAPKPQTNPIKKRTNNKQKHIHPDVTQVLFVPFFSSSSSVVRPSSGPPPSRTSTSPTSPPRRKRPSAAGGGCYTRRPLGLSDGRVGRCFWFLLFGCLLACFNNMFYMVFLVTVFLFFMRGFWSFYIWFA